MQIEPWYAYVIMAVALAGTALNVRGVRWCWPVWMVSNAASGVYLAAGGMWTQGLLQAVFLLAGAWGWVAWGRAERAARAVLAEHEAVVLRYEARLIEYEACLAKAVKAAGDARIAGERAVDVARRALAGRRSHGLSMN
jgi:hypothetical protein